MKQCDGEFTGISQPDTWTTKDGVTLLVSEMTDTHLENALKLCIRVALIHAGRCDGHWLQNIPDDLEWMLGEDTEIEVLSECYPKGTEGLLLENSKRKLFDVEKYIETKSGLRLLATLNALIKK